MAYEDELESALVAWSGVAGQFFTKKRKSWRKSSTQSISLGLSPPALPLPSSALNLLNGSTVPFPVLGKYESEKGEKSSEGGEGVFDDKGSDKGRKSERRVSVRDLAILPTQRVVRYVMLYRGEQAMSSNPTVLIHLLFLLRSSDPHTPYISFKNTRRASTRSCPAYRFKM